MSISNLSQLKAFLSSLGIQPRRALSQNFLIDGNVIRKIAAVLSPERGATILEVGPGPGALTEELLREEVELIAVEKDNTLAPALERFKGSGRGSLTVYNEDILAFPIEEKLAACLSGEGRAKMVGNLPYQLTTPILVRFLPLFRLLSSLTVMVQKEFADRLSAQPGCKEYGSITLFAQFYGTIRREFEISRNCFYPPPKIDSTVITLELRQPPLPEEQWDSFFSITRTAFQQRRKVLPNTLSSIYDKELVINCLKGLNLDPRVRPEELSLSDYLHLHSALSNQKGSAKERSE